MGKAVLVVDDDPWVRDMLELALLGEGYEVTLAGDGVEAIERVEARRPSLILVDLMMPRMNGFEFAEQLRLRGLRSAIPLLAVTGAGEGVWSTAGLEADGLVTKPFRLPELFDAVAGLAKS